MPPPSVENSSSSDHSSTALSSTPISPTSHSDEVQIRPGSTAAPVDLSTSPIIDLTGSDGEATIKLEARPPSASVSHGRVQSTQVEARIQAFREKLGKSTVEELEKMLENQLPSWIKRLAEEVLQKKMLKELEAAESLLLVPFR